MIPRYNRGKGREMKIKTVMLSGLIMAGSLLYAGGDNGSVGGTGYKTGGFFGLRGSYVFSLQSSIIGWPGGGYYDDNYDGNGGSFGVHLGGQEGQWRATLAYEYFDKDDQNYDLFLGQIDYLFLPNPGIVQPYIGLDAGYINYETPGADDSGGLAYGAATGITFAVSDHFDLDVGVRYLFATQDEVDHLGTVTFGFNYFY